MKRKISLLGLGAVLCRMSGFITTVEARHAHHWANGLNRVAHKSSASSGSSFAIATTDDVTPTVTTAIAFTTRAKCPEEIVDTVGVSRPQAPASTSPIPQAHAKALYFWKDVIDKVSNGRYRSQLTHTSKDEGSAAGVDSNPTFGTHPAVPQDSQTDNRSTALIAPSPEIVEGEDPPSLELRDIKHGRDLIRRQDGGYQSFVLEGFSSPKSSNIASDATASVTAYGGSTPTTSTTSTSSALSSTEIASPTSASGTSNLSPAISPTASPICPDQNGTSYTSVSGIEYQIVCDIDYVGSDFPFQLAYSFADCIFKCDAWNFNHHGVQCIAALFVPSREGYANDCYMKSKLVNPSPARDLVQGAIRIGFAHAVSSEVSQSITSSAVGSSNSLAASSSPTLASPSSTASTISFSKAPTPTVTYASGQSIIEPKVKDSHLHGPTENTPSEQYLDMKPPAGIKLSTDLLEVGANGDLSTDYSFSGQTGVLEVNSSTQSYLAPLTNTPHLSRDGGRGGMVNGEHLFIFCDTGSYSTTTATSDGDFLGFVSSSVAVDVGMKGLSGEALLLQDGIGEWSDNAGRMRGFAPLTEGEMAYNQDMQGKGQRYAVWPESDIIPLDATTGIIYAPVVYDNVNMQTKAAVFTYTGITLLTITAGGEGGPVAQRTSGKIFEQDEVEWGGAGGIRAWGSSGIGGDDGRVYLFGNVGNGILLARTSPANVADKDSVEFWNGQSWTKEMQTSSSKAYFIEGSFIDINVFYSPRHLTFIIVYLTVYADSTFYYRYLEADQGILPPFAPGGTSDSDYVENILKYKWSEQQTLYEAAQGLNGKYIYSGGLHLGYYGSDDIINGGSKVLLSWSAPTGLDPSTLTSEYQIITAEVEWS